MYFRENGRPKRLVRSLAVLLAFGLVVAACGNDDDDGASGPTTTTTAASNGDNGDNGDPGGLPDDLDPDGELNLSLDFTTWFGESFDPTKANAPGQWFNALIYGSLLHRTADGVYHDNLAKLEGTRIVDPSTIEVELYEGLTYTDGSPLDAEAVKFVIERNVAVGQGRMFRFSELGRTESIEVTSPTTLTIRLSAPVAGSYFDLLAHEETVPYSPAAAEADTLQENPVGAGPYMLRPGSFRDADVFILDKNPDFVHADRINVPTIRVVHVTADAAVNAYNSGAVDWSDTAINTAGQVNRAGYEVNVIPNIDSLGFLWLVCMTGVTAENPGGLPRTLPNGDIHPLGDVRVRQALNFATNKEQLIARTLQGLDDVEVMDQLWPNDSEFANPDLVNLYPYDPDRARELLADAGYADGLDLTFTVGAVSGAQTATGEVLQQQWEQVGINLELVTSQNLVTDFYVNRQIDFSGSTAGVKRSWTDKITRNWVGPSVGATCQPHLPEVGGDPQFLPLVQELQGLARDDARAVELWHEIQAIIVEGAFSVFMTLPPSVVLVNEAKIGLVDGGEIGTDTSKYWPTQVGFYYPDPFQVYVKR